MSVTGGQRGRFLGFSIVGAWLFGEFSRSHRKERGGNECLWDGLWFGDINTEGHHQTFPFNVYTDYSLKLC